MTGRDLSNNARACFQVDCRMPSPSALGEAERDYYAWKGADTRGPQWPVSTRGEAGAALTAQCRVARGTCFRPRNTLRKGRQKKKGKKTASPGRVTDAA